MHLNRLDSRVNSSVRTDSAVVSSPSALAALKASVASVSCQVLAIRLQAQGPDFQNSNRTSPSRAATSSTIRLSSAGVLAANVTLNRK